MNKSLIALAALGAFTTIASAQSSVTLYGRLDENLTIQDPGRLAAATSGGQLGKSVTKLQDGNVNGKGGSRLGFRGTEDLGDGLRAYFLLEAQIFPENGAAGASTTLTPAPNTAFFSRQSWVAIGHKSFGDIRLGRIESLTRENNVRFNDASGEAEFNVVETVVTTQGTARPLFQNFGSRVDNGITYKSPVLGGFQGSIIVGLGERQKATVVTNPAAGITTTVENKAAEYRGLGITYAGGPILAGLSYEELNGGSASGSYNKVATVGGSYDFGIVKVHAAYQNTKDLGGQYATTTTTVNTNTAVTTVVPLVKGVDHEAWNLGVAVPLGNFTVKAQYTGSTVDRINGLSDLDQDKYGVSVNYAFSKRTAVYAAFTERGGDFKETFARKNEYVMGLAHTF